MKKQTIRQRILRFLYPYIKNMGGDKYSKIAVNNNNLSPNVSFYDLEFEQNSGQKISFSEFKGKKVLLVNTASDCGFTGQYEELQSLYEKYKDQLIIIGFPANDFGKQEKGSDEQISQFCQINYGVDFPIAKKGVVIKEQAQQEVFQWLTDEKKNGWSNQAPVWNFNKFLINEEGVLTHYFGSSISPLDESFIKTIEN